MKPVVVTVAAAVVALGAYYVFSTQGEAPAPEQASDAVSAPATDPQPVIQPEPVETPVEQVETAVEEAVETATEAAQDAVDTATEAAEDAVENAQDAVEEAADAVKDTASSPRTSPSYSTHLCAVVVVAVAKAAAVRAP